MLDVLRKGAQTWIAKALLSLLVLSFGVWGISGSLLHGTGGNAVVTVGKTKVTPTEFRLAYSRQINQVSQQLGTRLTSEQAKAFGIEGQVYGQLAAGAALDEQAREMNLGLSQDRLAKYIGEDPAFQGADGKFSRQNFTAVLRNAGMTENDYIRNRQQYAVRTQIIQAVADGFTPPKTLVDALSAYSTEERDVEYMLVTGDAIDPVKAPAEDVLKTYFEANKAKYKAPEYRKFTYVTLRPEDIADPATVSDDAVKQDYEAHKDRYSVAEQRTIDQLVFADEAAAKAAEDKLKAGASFDALVAEQGKKPADVRIGTFTKASIPDPNLADAAFSVAKAGDVSGIVPGTFGPVILRVADIKPQTVQPLDAVKETIRKELALVDANNALLDVHDAFEDARAGGATIAEAAAKEKLKPVTVEALDRTGAKPDGTIVKDLPESSELIRTVFDNQPGDEIQPISIGTAGYVWATVDGVTEARDRTLDEVREKVVADWTAEQTADAVGKKATTLLDEVRKGKAFAEVAAGAKLAVETKASLKRSDKDAVFGEAATRAAFSGPNGVAGIADAASGDGKIVLHVTAVRPGTAPEAGSPAAQQAQTVAARASDDILDEIVSQLQTRYGVSINQALGEQSIAY